MKDFLHYHFKTTPDSISFQGLIAVEDIEEIYEVSGGGVVISTGGMKKVATDTFLVLLKQLRGAPASPNPKASSDRGNL